MKTKYKLDFERKINIRYSRKALDPTPCICRDEFKKRLIIWKKMGQKEKKQQEFILEVKTKERTKDELNY